MPNMMRAAVVQEGKKVKVEEVPAPIPKPEEVL